MELFIIVCAILCIIGTVYAVYLALKKPKTKPQVVVQKNNVVGGDLVAGDKTISGLKTLREVKETGPKLPKVISTGPRRVTRDIPKSDTRYYPQPATQSFHTGTAHVDHGSSLVGNIATAIIVHELLKDDKPQYTSPPCPVPSLDDRIQELDREECRRSAYVAPAPAYEPPAPSPSYSYESPSVSSFSSSSDSYSSSSSYDSSSSYSSSDSSSSSFD